MPRSFHPTPVPPGRLVRLGVVFDRHTPKAMITPLARMCERAGVDAVWIANELTDLKEIDRGTAPNLQGIAIDVLAATERIAVGLVLRGDALPATGLSLALASRGAEVAIVALDQVDRPEAAIRTLLGDAGVVRVLAEPGTTFRLAPLIATADEILLSGWNASDLETAADEVRAESVEAGRDPATLGVAAMVPVSVGRTVAEATARVGMDDRFGLLGHPADTGIFGTLEECQDRVIALAYAGVTDLLCVLPGTGDVHDVIAQLTAMVVGTTTVLQPGTLRSPAPPPPEGWGGRPDQPPQPRISAGSRRR